MNLGAEKGNTFNFLKISEDLNVFRCEMIGFGKCKKYNIIARDTKKRNLFDLNGSPVAQYFSNGLKPPTI